jgi:beta-glucosidase
MRPRGLLLLASAGLVTVSPLAHAQSPQTAPATIDFERRAADLVGKMTLEEKASQVVDIAPAITRLGVPAYNWWSEGLHGVARAGEATVFPQAIGLAATWDVPLVRRTAATIADEFRAKYVQTLKPDGSSDKYRGLTVWSPNVNIFRDPRWGRGQETYGEDPYLTSRFGVAFIQGLQGDDPGQPKTIASIKHFAVHSGPEANRHREDVRPSPRDFEDTYLPAFKAALVEGKAQGLMCAYNAVDGIPACGSPLLATLVRDEWGFKGHIVSDCAAIADFFKEDAHRYTRTPEEAAAAALNAGTDLFCAEFGHNKSADPKIVVNAVRQGFVAETVLDTTVKRLMEARLRLGILKDAPPSPYATIPATLNDTPGHALLSLEAARASMVLLKNEGLLPLKQAPKKIVVIGPNAESVDALVGNYNGTPSAPVTLRAGLAERFPNSNVTFVEGTGHVGAPLKLVPASTFCADAECKVKGLKVEEFKGTALAGKPVRTAMGEDVTFSWGRPLRQERTSSIRWTGFVTPQDTGPYRFKLDGDGGYRILIDGREVVNAWDAAEPAMIADGEITLTAGKRYPVSVEAIQSGSRGTQRLLWSNFSEREEAALKAASDADLIVFAGGLTAKLEGEEMRVAAKGFAGGDRTSIDLPEPQEALLKRLHATGKPVVLVLMNGSALSVNWADKNLPAIVEAWYPGGNGGRAVAELIAGDFSPSGRLPVTFYKSADQLPAFGDYAMAGRTYRYFSGEPLYRFGHGLSYTRFAYSGAKAEARVVQAGAPARVTVRVTNTGSRDGHEVVQLYTSRSLPGAPIRSLAGFQRVFLKRGGSRVVEFTLAPESVSIVQQDGQRSIQPGPVSVWVGGGQESSALGQRLQLRVKGTKQLASAQDRRAR